MELKRKHNRMLQNMSVIGKHYTLRRTTICCSVPDILWGYYTRKGGVCGTSRQVWGKCDGAIS
jgi:hypothetical protein